MTKLRRNKKGFTLAELLIVIAIIGVLVAIAMPIFRTEVDEAEKLVLQANCRTVLSEATVDVLKNGTFTGDIDNNTDETAQKTFTYDNVTYRAVYDKTKDIITVTCGETKYGEITSSTIAPRS